MKKLIDLILKPKDPSVDWTITRMRAAMDKPIGPRYPTGLFVQYNSEEVDD
jgi:hypothetical protein